MRDLTPTEQASVAGGFGSRGRLDRRYAEPVPRDENIEESAGQGFPSDASPSAIPALNPGFNPATPQPAGPAWTYDRVPASPWNYSSPEAGTSLDISTPASAWEPDRD